MNKVRKFQEKIDFTFDRFVLAWTVKEGTFSFSQA